MSPTAIVAAIVFFIFYKYHGWKLFFINITLLLVVSIGLYTLISIDYLIIPWESMRSTVVRTGSWMSAFNGIFDNLLFGVGPGMGGYWITHYYTEFFLSSVEASNWYLIGQTTFVAPIFSSLLSIVFDYGIVPILFVLSYFIYTKTFQYIFSIPIARASLAAMFIASFGLDMYAFMGYWIFLALTLSKTWHLLDPSLSINKENVK